LPVCNSAPLTADALHDFSVRRERVAATIHDGRAVTRVVLSSVGPRLLELSDVLPSLRTPEAPRGGVRSSARGFVTYSTSNADGARMEASILGALVREPRCLGALDASVALEIVAVERDDHVGTARVYAASPMLASLVACLEEQLGALFEGASTGHAFTVRYHLLLEADRRP
jgi:hypothetical protein